MFFSHLCKKLFRKLRNVIVIIIIIGSFFLLFQLFSLEVLNNTIKERNLNKFDTVFDKNYINILRDHRMKTKIICEPFKDCSKLGSDNSTKNYDLNKWKNKINLKLSEVRMQQKRLNSLLNVNKEKTPFKDTEFNKAKVIKNERDTNTLIQVLGVHRDDIHLYRPNENYKFECIKSKESIEFSKVNDNYCDCVDQSDEPGTSACSLSRFYCSFQLSFQKASAISFPSGVVGDSICDCCDGSDEWENSKIESNLKNKNFENIGVFYAPCYDRCDKLRQEKQEEEEIRVLAASTRFKYIKIGLSINNGIDYGPQNVFYEISTKCYEHSVNEYIYTICPFVHVKQQQKNSQNVLILGKNSKWLSRSPYDFKISMENGDNLKCPYDQMRSTIIKYECGISNIIKKVVENEKCKYFVLMKTPAAC